MADHVVVRGSGGSWVDPAVLRTGAFAIAATTVCALAGAFGGPFVAIAVAWPVAAGLVVLARRANVRTTESAEPSPSTDDLRARVEPVTRSLRRLGETADLVADMGFAIAGNAEQTAEKTRMISGHIDRVNHAVEVASERMTELSRTIHEVAENARAGGEVGREAMEATRQTDASVTRLGESSAEIGNVVRLIDSIAAQTNLLALNATIEAARAGDAGRGFAVVASEVRELANETARATGDIGRRIQTIQADTRAAVTAIQRISEVVERINTIQTSIASAVVEQAASADAIQRNVRDAAEGGVHIRANMAGLTTAAGSTASGAEETKEAIARFSKMTAEIRGLAQSLEDAAANH